MAVRVGMRGPVAERMAFGGVSRRRSRPALAALLIAMLVWTSWDRLALIDPAAILTGVAGVAPWRWAAAAVLTAVGMAAIGRYDMVMHRLLGTGIDAVRARRAGMAAIAISQATGMGLAVGTAVRLRCLPDLSLGAAARLTAVTAGAFGAGLAVVASVAIVGAGAPVEGLGGIAVAILVGAGLLMLGSVALPSHGCWSGVPGAGIMARLTGLVAIDTLAAFAAFVVLAPDLSGIDGALLLPAFLIALGAGLVAATPGGVGAFEAALLALLPVVDPAALVSAALAWRIVAHAAPAIVAAVAMLALPGLFARRDVGARPALAPGAVVDHRTSLRAEAGLARQPGAAALSGMTPRPLAVAWATRHALVTLGEPLRPGDAGAMLDALRAVATDGGRAALAYKLAPRDAVLARRLGWRLARTGSEAVIDAAAFDLARPERRGLRRKLRQLASAGVTVVRAGAVLPLDDMARVSAAWAERNGGERGVSMGRFSPDYVSGQEVWLALRDGALVGFATFHAGRTERTLDLLRPSPDAPPGTAQGLISAAIDAARADGVAQVSLAAVPTGPLAPWLERRRGSGLHRFKQGFAPRWVPLYAAAPGPLSMALGGLELLRAITAPPPLRAGGDAMGDFPGAGHPTQARPATG